MYSKIEEQLGRTINPIEFEMLDDLVKDYSINEIVECMKQYKGKPIKYIIQVLKNKPKQQKFEWLDKEIVNQEIDEECKKEHEEFMNFLEEFRNG